MRKLLGLPAKSKYETGAVILLAAMGGSILVGTAVLLPEPLPAGNGLIAVVVLIILLLCMIGLIILVFLGRQEARIECVLTGAYWTKWHYTDDERLKMPEGRYRQASTVYIGPLGVCWSGQRSWLEAFGNGLLDVQIRPGAPPVLRFSYYETRRSASTTTSGGTIFDFLFLVVDLIQLLSPNQVTCEILVPIPSDREAEADELIRRFRAGHLGIPSPSRRDVQLATWGIVGAIVLLALATVLIIPPLTARSTRAYPTPTPTLDALATRRRSAANERLSILRTQIDSKLSDWEKSASPELTRLSAEAAGLKSDHGIKEIDYGYCKKNSFFVYVLDSIPDQASSVSDTTGFAFVRDNNPYECAPAYWAIDRAEPMADSWYRVEIRTYGATVIPTLTALAAQFRRTPGIIPTPPPQ